MNTGFIRLSDSARRKAMELIAQRKKYPPSTKEQCEALERDFCIWLAENSSLSYEQRNQKIIAALTELNLPYSMLAALATHMLIRTDMARFAMQREQKFEPLIAAGQKKALKDSKTRLPRKVITKDGKTMEMIIKDFLLKPFTNGLRSIKLWELFYDELVRLKLKALRKKIHKKTPDKESYTFLTVKGEKGEIKFGRFEDIIAKYRKKNRISP